MPPLPPVEQHIDQIGAHMDAWQVADAHTRDLHRRLSETPGGDRAVWDDLVQAESARADVSAELGRAIGLWVARGGSLELVDPVESESSATTSICAPESVDSGLPADAPSPIDSATDLDVTCPPSVDADPEPSAPRAVHAPAAPERLEELRRVGIGGARREEERVHAQHALAHVVSLRQMLAASLTRAHLPRVSSWLAHVRVIEDLPTDTLHAVATALGARLREFKHRHPHASVDRPLHELREWIAVRKVGFVHGLAHSHQPHHGTWAADATAALTRLSHPTPLAATTPAPPPDALLARLTTSAATMSTEDLRVEVWKALQGGVSPTDPRLCKALEARHEDLKGDGRFARVRKAVRDAVRAAAPIVVVAPKDAPPVDWPFWHLTRGKTAVIVGGDPRASNRDKIRDAFGFAKVEWPEHNARVLSQLKERANNGSIDLFIFIRFGGHIVDDMLLKSVRKDITRWVRSERGYGVSEVRTSMEAHWANVPAPASGDTPIEAAVGSAKHDSTAATGTRRAKAA